NIAFVDVISSLSKTAAYGAAGSNGIIAIYRKRPGEHSPVYREVDGILHYTHPGYYQALHFDSPDYRDPKSPDKPDFRTTLYWDPDIRTDAATLQRAFYTADRATVYEIRLEGVTRDGQPVVASQTFIVN
ncbi:MAG: hypothetical protein R3330_18430, partial [Saprospiraceae bacterium]|nr:hypothetical protein [Saprospiraceae bacterium]